MQALVRLLAIFVMCIGISNPAMAASAWLASVGGDERYRSPHEACYLGVMGTYIENDRPGRPPTAQYRILSASVQPYGDGDYRCQLRLNLQVQHPEPG